MSISELAHKGKVKIRKIFDRTEVVLSKTSQLMQFVSHTNTPIVIQNQSPFICINAIVIANTVISSFNIRNINLAKTIFAW